MLLPAAEKYFLNPVSVCPTNQLLCQSGENKTWPSSERLSVQVQQSIGEIVSTTDHCPPDH